MIEVLSKIIEKRSLETIQQQNTNTAEDKEDGETPDCIRNSKPENEEDVAETISLQGRQNSHFEVGKSIGGDSVKYGP